MTRIEVVGCSGGGKSTLARRLGARLGLDVVHLDQLHWLPGWVERDRAERTLLFDRAVASDRRVIDGTFNSSMVPRFILADLIVWLDQPRSVCLRRVVIRWLTHLGRHRQDMAPGCHERVSLEFARYIWDFRRVTSPKIEAAIAAAGAAGKVVRLRSDREIEAFVESLS